MAKRQLKRTIKDVDWTFRIMSKRAFVKEHGYGFRAVVMEDTRQVDFCKPDFSKGVLSHELMHVYVATCNIGDSTLDTIAIEEVCCKIAERHLDEMVELRNDIYREFVGE